MTLRLMSKQLQTMTLTKGVLRDAFSWRALALVHGRWATVAQAPDQECNVSLREASVDPRCIYMEYHQVYFTILHARGWAA